MGKPEHLQAKPTNASQAPRLPTGVTAEIYAGPIPQASELRAYEEILPGLAHRIMAMAEAQSDHRRYLEKKVITHDGRRAWAGLIFAFIIVVLAVILGTYLVSTGKSVSGLVTGIAPIAAVAGTFIYQNPRKK